MSRKVRIELFVCERSECDSGSDQMIERDETRLVKILYFIPAGEDDAGECESLWAYSLGNNLYELQNIPVYAEHLNVEDVVRCEESAETKPVIRELVRRSGNRTLRVIFCPETPDDTCVDIMWELGQKKILSEKATHKHFSFNVPPNADYVWARDYLRTKDTEGLLWLYE